MAKNKIKIDVIIDGKMQKVSVDAEKLGRKLDKVSEASVKADRNIKGVAGASSNASKNFSKMSQGMGGLVGAYAALAAQIFAISAAFNFLKSAGDLKVLEASQAAYAANTGLAMKVLANDIVSATNAQIAFQDASQAAAIGTAAGLSPDQLKQLGKAANDLSVTLGRDVTDSFNRLVRGVTKAEPELLDELGIILRLKDAQEDYGRSIGKNAEDLSQFEKSQAVVNKVLEEANRVAAVTPEGAVNQYNQLAKAFDDVLIKAKLLADQIVGPLAKVLTETPSLAIASFLLLLKGPLAAMGVNFSDIAKGARESAAAQKIAATEAQAAYQKTQLTIQSTTAAIREQAAAAVAAGSQSKILQQFGSGGAMTSQARATLKRALAAAEKNYNEHNIVVTGIFKGMDIKIVRDFQLAMAQMDAAEAGKVSKSTVNVSRIVAIYASGMAKIKVAGAWLATWGTKALSAFGWIGIVVTGVQILIDQFGLFQKTLTDSEKKALETAKALEQTRDRFAELNKEYKDFLATQEKLAGVGRTQDVIANLGRSLEMTSVADFEQALKDYQAYDIKIKQFEKTASDRRDAISDRVSRGLDNQNLADRKTAEALSSIEKQLELDVKDLKEGAQLIATQLSTAATTVLGDFEGRSKAVVEFQRLIKEGLDTGTFDIEGINKARLGIIELGKDIQEQKQLALEANNVTASWVQSMSPLSQGAKAIQAINLELANYKDIQKGLVEGEAGLTADQKERQTLLEENLKIIEASEKRAFNLKSANLSTDIAREISLRGSSKEYQGILNSVYDIQKAEASIADKRGRIADLKNVKDLSAEQNDENERTIALLQMEIYLEEQGLITRKEQVKYLQDILPAELQLRQIRLDTEVMSQAKEYLGVLSQQVNTQKELINVQQTVAKLRMQRVERDTQRSNPFAFLREEQRVAEATYRLELSMVGTKITQINNEFDIKRQMIAMEHVLLDAKLRVSELELKNRAAATDLEQGEREALQALAAATASQRALISQNLGGQFQLLDAQQRAAIEGIIDELDKLDFARENLSDMAIITQNIVRDLHSGLSNVFSDLLTNKVSSFKTAMLKAVEGVVDSFAKTLSDMFARNLIEGFQSFYSTKQSNPILGAAQQGSIKVASTLQEGAAAVAAAIRAAFTDGALQIAGAKEKEGILEKVSEFVGPPEKGTVAKGSNDFFENLVGIFAGQKTDTSPKGVPTVDSRQPLASQRQLPITDARKLGSMFMPKNLAGVVDTQARFGPASDAQKLGSMVGKSSATFGSSQPNQGMFSGLMNFMKTLFSPQNPVFKGLLGLFSSIIPLLGKILPFLGTLLTGALSIFGFANGGMVKGGFRAYANGGIVSKPTLGLVGEGKYNEAIVPMPNGNAIPVDLKGAGQQQNNVTVNVSVDGNTGSMQQDSSQAGNLGQAIARAVQQELQNQKRSGGILSPYGVS